MKILSVFLLQALLPGALAFSAGFPGKAAAGPVKEIRIPSVPAPLPAGLPAKKKKLTVMVFKNAKNDLEEFGLLDMNEMESVGSGENMNVIVEYGRLKKTGDESAWHGVRRYYVLKDTGDAVNSEVLWEKKKADMGDWKELADFINWGKSNFPAEKYLLIIWNHGNGWKKSAKKETYYRGISFDDETGNHISTPQLRMALEKGGKVDVLAFDACLMQTAEVAYEVGKFADIVVGSEETEPGDGYPYELLLEKISGGDLTPEEIGRAIVESYRKRNSELYMDTTQSAVRTSALPGLLRKLGEWASEALSSGDGNALKRAFSFSHGFYDFNQKDLYDFMLVVEKYAGNKKLKAKSREVMDYLINETVVANGISGYQHRAAKGLSIYAPFKYVYDDSYEELLWAKDGLWDEFLKNR